MNEKTKKRVIQVAVILVIGGYYDFEQVVEQTVAWIQEVYEESPGSTGQGCRITSGVGNYRESATETFRRNSTAVVRLKW